MTVLLLSDYVLVDEITIQTEALSLADQDAIVLLSKLPDDVTRMVKITSKKTLYMTSDRRVVCDDAGTSKIVMIAGQYYVKLCQMQDKIKAMYDKYEATQATIPDMQILGVTYVRVCTYFNKTVVHFVALQQPGSKDTKLGVCFTYPRWRNFLDYLVEQEDE
jgi:hypothetical protein